MSYGLVGLSLFGLLLLVIFGRAPLASIAYFAPVMLFSITHVGVRSSEFWVFLAPRLRAGALRQLGSERARGRQHGPRAFAR